MAAPPHRPIDGHVRRPILALDDRETDAVPANGIGLASIGHDLIDRADGGRPSSGVGRNRLDWPTSSAPTIRVFLIDDHCLWRAGLSSMLDGDDDIAVVGTAGDGREALGAVPRAAPHVVLIDIRLPELDGIELTRRLRRVAPQARVIMLSALEGSRYVSDAIAAGAEGYLTKCSDPAELRLAIRAVHAGRCYFSPRVADAIHSLMSGRESPGSAPRSRVDQLTPREREVFLLAASGLCNKEIAQRLSITVHTAKKHRENLQRKLDCHSAVELALLAVREGLIGS